MRVDGSVILTRGECEVASGEWRMRPASSVVPLNGADFNELLDGRVAHRLAMVSERCLYTV
jgi:hypothetical protein